MENLKSEPFDEREEGEISLDDVSSSEEMHYSNCNKNSKKSGIGKKYIKREVDILSQDSDHGKENRRFSNEFIGPTSKPLAATLQEKNDDLLPISSEEDIEFVGLPGTSKQFTIHTEPKKKRKKKKKKKSGSRMFVIDDLVSKFDDDTEVAGGVSDDHKDFNVSRPYGDINGRSPSPMHRMNSPPRHSGWHLPGGRSPVRHYRSPLKHSRSPIRRSPSPRQRSPRKFLSSRRSPAFNSDRRASHKPPREISPDRCKGAYFASLLKKAVHVETVGSITPVNQQKCKESSLKDKLMSNMMIKSLPETKENVNSWQCDIGDSQNIAVKADDEEDVESLRRKALETKQPKNDTKSKDINTTTYVNSNIDSNTNVSDDEEDLQLRMIALRSAVMNKHHVRVQSGQIKKKSGIDIKDESPFSDDFLDSLDSYLDGSADVTYNENQMITSPIAQLSNAENAHVEDMDLDSDVEREKENSQPYSPTDELSPRTFIEPNFPDESLTETFIDQFPTQNINENLTNIIVSPYSGSSTLHFDDYIANVMSPYSPSDPTCTPRIENASRQGQPPLTTRDPRLRRHINSNTEISYSPNDTVTLDPTLPVCPPEIPFARTPFNTHVNSRLLNSSNLIVVPLAKNPINPTEITSVSLQQPTLPLDSNVTTQSHLIHTLNTKDTNAVTDKVQSDITYDDIIRDLAEYTGEPLYLQGVPDITKDANKIPTLVNRTLVPVPILKTNKKLQQPLPNKKPDSNGEPTFKSAEMLPVNVQSQSIKSSTVFKPIKLQSVTKKSQVMIPPAAAFNNFLNDETSAVLPNDGSKIVENPNSASGNKCCEIPVNLKTTDASESVVVPESESKTKIRRSRAPRNKAETAETTRRKTCEGGTSTILANVIMNEKITIKRNLKITDNKNNKQRSNTSAGEAKKSDVNAKKKDSVKKSDPKRGRRSKSVSRSGDKSDESLKNNSDVSRNSDDIAKQKKEITKKVSKTKTTKRSESNRKRANIVNGHINKSMTIEANDKNRRSSVDEDEETLRAALLASLPKRMKTSNSQTTPTTSKFTIGSAQSIKNASSDIKALLKEKQQSGTAAMLPPVTVPAQSGSIQKTLAHSKITANTASGVGTAKKRLSTLINQGPSKKIVKTTTVSSSDTTKILNVAEKIVDNEIQRRLSQQQAAIELLSSKAQQNSKTNLPRLSMKDSIAASISPKISASKNIDRMIIRLGEDSDSDSDGDDGTTKAKTKNINMPLKETSKAPTIPVTDFEKSVEEFLRSQREKQESSTTASTNATAKSSTLTPSKETLPLTNTPLAVRHLPASKQEEYRRLKQCIAEREQKKMNRTAQTTTKNSVQATSSNEEPSTSSASTYIITANGTTSTINTQTKIIMPSADETQKTALDRLYKPIAIQTQIAQSALELLQPKINADPIDDNANNHISEPPLLQDIPIKTDPSLVETTSNIIGDNQSINAVSNTLHDEGTSDLNLIGPMRPNLTISFANTRDDSIPCIRHVTMVGSNHVPKEPLSIPQVTPLGIRILTTDQLNLKYEHTETDVIDNDMLMSSSKSGYIDTHSIDASITLEPCKVEANGDVVDPSTLNYQPIVNSEPLTLHTIKRNDSSPTHSNHDGLDTTIELDSTIILNPTTVINDIESTIDTVLNTPINNPSTSSYDVQLSTEFELPVQEQKKKYPEIFESDVQVQLETLYNLPDDQQRIQLTTIEKGLVAKRYVVLHDLTQMAQDLQQWEIQTNLAADVKRLRKELQMAEERLQVQRLKTMKMSPAVTQAHNTINQGRDECMKLMKLCQGIGSKIMGPAYKIPSTGGLLLIEKLREVANMTKQLSKNKVSTIDANAVQNSGTIIKLTSDTSCNENSDFNLQSNDHNVETNQHSASVKIENDNESEVIMANACANSSNETLLNVSMENNVHKANEVIETKDNVTFLDSNNSPLENMDNVDISSYESSWFKIEDENPPIQPAVSYESVLTSLNTPRYMDPNGVLCPYELMGTCSDEACSYNHLDTTRS